MISRLTTYAVTFAVLAGASIALAATVSAHALLPIGSTTDAVSATPAVKTVTVIELPRVTVTAKRIPG